MDMAIGGFWEQSLTGELDYEAVAWMLACAPTLEPPIIANKGNGTYTRSFAPRSLLSSQERIQQAVERVLQSKGSLLSTSEVSTC